MFPIRDHTGKLCGFSGRTIANHPAKYVNTKDTPLFRKSNLMYGFDKAKDSVAKKNFFVLSEGQMDVVMQHQVGIKYSFASMGTALTPSHVKIISRFAKKGVIAYDGDQAGIKAAFKAAELFTKSMIDTTVVIFDNGEDPADLIAAGRTQEIMSLMESGVPAIKFCVDRILLNYDLNNPFDKTNAFKDVKAFSSQMTPLVRQNIMEFAMPFIGTITNEHIIQIRQGEFSPAEAVERSLIKAAILSGKGGDIRLIMSAEKCFTMKDEIAILKRLEYSHEKLTAIFMDETVVPSGNVKQDMIHFKIRCIDKFLAKIRGNTNMSNDDKLSKIKEAMSKKIELTAQAKEEDGNQ
jgi:DNA primase